MKTTLRIFAVAVVLSLFACTKNQDPEEDLTPYLPSTPSSPSAIKGAVSVVKSDWSVLDTKSISFNSIPWETDEKLSILDEDGKHYSFSVAMSEGNQAILKPERDTLIAGRKYRVLYPKTTSVDGLNLLCMGFSTYSSEEDVYESGYSPKDWLASPWTTYSTDDGFSFQLDRINCWLNIEFVAPANMDVARACLSCNNERLIMKGNFDFSGESIVDHNTESRFYFEFPLSKDLHDVKAGQKYTITASMFPRDYSKSRFNLHIFDVTGNEYYAPVDLQDVKAGCVINKSVAKFKKYNPLQIDRGDYVITSAYDEETETAYVDLTINGMPIPGKYYLVATNYVNDFARPEDIYGYMPIYMKFSDYCFSDWIEYYYWTEIIRNNDEGKYHFEITKNEANAFYHEYAPGSDLTDEQVAHFINRLYVFDSLESCIFIESNQNFCIPLEAPFIDIYVYFPDKAFKSYCSRFDVNGDGKISEREVGTVASIDVSGMRDITSLEGIEHFTDLVNLNCSNCSLTSLDVSSNHRLQTLDCTGNPDLKEIWLRKGQQIRTLNIETHITTIKYRE